MKIIISLLLLLTINRSFSQYKYDNALFKTVYWEDLCDMLKQNPDALILDVRSKGEHYDTSTFKSLNIGHLKDAMNINISEVGNRLKEIEAYKSKPVFIYCSHSQRSRRVSKMLADSGFVNVHNINGGVSNLRMFGFKEECDLLSSNLPYQIISPKALMQNKGTEYFILDVRADSSFKGIALQERKNAYGKLKNAVNIPLSTLEQNFASLPKDKKILIVDEGGNESVAAAELLTQKGYTKLAVLFNGLDAVHSEIPEKDRTFWVNPVSYHTINAEGFDALMKKRNVTVIDIRTAEEFNNASKESFRNIGVLKGAINIPFADWDKQLASLPASKDNPIALYSFGGGSPELFEVAKKLSAQGYKNVNIVLGGLFAFRWRAANIKGLAYLKDWVVNVPADNL
jgi:rhodanese-related sulfurtransferase